MTKSILTLTILILAVAAAGLPGRLQAQETYKAPTEKKESKRPAPSVTPFHGKLKGVDASANTIAVGALTVHVTSDTKVMKAGKPATLADGVVGEEVAGAYKKTESGQLTATTVRFG